MWSHQQQINKYDEGRKNWENFLICRSFLCVVWYIKEEDDEGDIGKKKDSGLSSF